jgi:peptidyl-prolyl cis-trans isomerase C
MTFSRPMTISLALTLGTLVSACDKGPSDNSKVMAVVNGEAITEKNYGNYLQLRRARSAPVADKEEEQKVVLNELIDRVLMTQYATQSKLDQDLDVHYRIKRVQENILVQAMIHKTLQDLSITEDDLKKRFQQDVANTHPMEYRARHILVRSEDDAKEIIKQLKAKADFAKLATEKSIDTQSGKDGGKLDWINQSMLVPEFFNAIKDMKKGDTTETPVKTQYGWHVVKVDDTRMLKIPTFEQYTADNQAKDDLERRIRDSKIDGLLKDLKGKAKITIN